MDKKKKSLLMQDVRSMNKGACISGVGFLLYLGAAALGWILIKNLLAVLFGVVAIWTFLSVAELRQKDKNAIGYNLLWGTASLALMLGACAVLGIKQQLGL